MFPLRKAYTRRLLHEVGFQRIETYGDVQETYLDDEPDFFVHVAEWAYREDDEEFGPERSPSSRRGGRRDGVQTRSPTRTPPRSRASI